MMNVEDIIDILAVDLLGVVPDDEAIVISTNKGGNQLYQNKILYLVKAFRNICKRITGEEVELLDLDNGEGKFTKLIKLLFS